MHLFTTHLLNLRTDWAENKYFQLQTNTHNALPHYSPATVDNGLGREQGKAMLISSHTLTHKHNAILPNSHSTIENGFGREQGKQCSILQANKHNAILQNSHTKIENGLGRERGKLLFISVIH